MTTEEKLENKVAFLTKKVESLEKTLSEVGAIKKYNDSCNSFMVISVDGVAVINGEVFNPLEVLAANRKLIAERNVECDELRMKITALKSALKGAGGAV